MRSPQSYRPSGRPANGLTDTWLQLLSSFELSSEKNRLTLLFKWLDRMQLHHDRGYRSGSFQE